MVFSVWRISSGYSRSITAAKSHAVNDRSFMNLSYFSTPTYGQFAKVQHLNGVRRKRVIVTIPRWSCLEHSQPIHQSLIKLKSINNSHRTSRFWKNISSTPSNRLSSNQLLVIFLLFAALGAALGIAMDCRKAHAEGSSDKQLKRINDLLGKKPELRTTDEKIELFNYLLEKGEEEAKKSKGQRCRHLFWSSESGA